MVVGAGWAGLSAAVHASLAGWHVTLFEAAAQPGGRARSLSVHDAQGCHHALDNGQHILIGAYTDTLALMRQVGLAPEGLLLRLPLTLVDPAGVGLRLPDLPSPWDVALGVIGAPHWQASDKLGLLVQATRWRLAGFRCDPMHTVAALCRGMPKAVMRDLIEPLCVSALNTPAERASGQVFLRVLRDALFGVRGGSQLLLPRAPLGELLPEAACAWLQARGAVVRLGHRVQRLLPAQTMTDPAAESGRPASPRWMVDDAPADRVVLALPPAEAARLVSALPDPSGSLARWADRCLQLRHEAIATVYVKPAVGQVALRLPAPMVALASSDSAPAQFVFDRQWLALGSPPRQGHGAATDQVLAFVVSASNLDRATLTQRVLQQALDQLGLPHAEVLQTVVEKRATFACTPGLERPGWLPDALHAASLRACGDHIEGPYPATLEGAVRSGRQAALMEAMS